MDRRTLNHTNLHETFDAVTQSYRTIEISSNNSLKAHIVVAHLPGGSGFSSQQDMIENDVKSRYFTIVNSDNFCGVRAVIIAKAFVDSNNKNQTEIEKKKNKAYLNKLTREHSGILEKELQKVT